MGSKFQKANLNKVTVIIPNWNGEKYLKACMDSLLQQTLLPKILVVDNGSTDGGVAFLKENYKDGQALEDGRILSFKILELKENTGFCHACNVGIEAADTPFVFLLNNDTICAPEATEKLLWLLERNHRAFSVQAKMLSMGEGNPIDDCGDYYCALGWAFTPGKDKSRQTYDSRAYITSACGGAAMYRKSLFAEFGMFDEEHFCYLEDVDLGIRAGIYGWRNLYEPAAVVYHAGSGSSGSRYNEFKQKLTAANNLYLIYKNFPALMLLINAPFFALGILIKMVYFMKKGLGLSYLQGLLLGCRKIADHPERKVPFTLRHIPSYISLQLALWGNTIRRLMG